MKRTLITAVLLVASAVPSFAQTLTPASSADSGTIVATVNGETITRAWLDQLWNRMPERVRGQYQKTGGKLGFLQNYIGKRLLLQNALKGGFDKLPEVQAELEAAKESALFDLYVRDVVGSQFVNEATIRSYYDQHPGDFTMPERAKVRAIVVSRTSRPVAEARETISNAMQGLFAARTAAGADVKRFVQEFAVAATKVSEDPSAPSGGDLGWVSRDQLDRRVGEAVFTMKKNTMSGIIEGDEALYLLFVEGREEASVEPYESARPAIREFLMAGNVQKVLEIVNKTTAELRATGKVTIYADNVQ